ncbi:MAG: hypothetical protein RR448_08495 [Niameybacter sp.]|uniref:hypothetical protein n=1 Tax=Niameybacter sp. TaxID=2033640 RepID=UPI002FC7AAFE
MKKVGKLQMGIGSVLVVVLVFSGCQATYSKAAGMEVTPPVLVQETTVELSEAQMETFSNQVAEQVFDKVQGIVPPQVREEIVQEHQPEVSGEYDIQQEIIKAAEDISFLDTMHVFRQQTCVIGEKTYSIEGYSEAQMDEQGKFMLDDGQRWAIIIREGEKVYPVYGPKYNQLGQIEYTTYLDEENGLHIVVYDIQGAGMAITEYSFDTKEKAFVGKLVYEASNINYFTSDIELAP